MVSINLVFVKKNLQGENDVQFFKGNSITDDSFYYLLFPDVARF